MIATYINKYLSVEDLHFAMCDNGSLHTARVLDIIFLIRQTQGSIDQISLNINLFWILTHGC